jgi:hypothetical protein
VKRGVVFLSIVKRRLRCARGEARNPATGVDDETRLARRKQNALVEPPSDAHLFYPLAFITLPLSDARFFFDASETDASSNSTQSGALSLS